MDVKVQVWYMSVVGIMLHGCEGTSMVYECSGDYVTWMVYECSGDYVTWM